MATGTERALVTIVGVAAWGAALVVIVRLRATRRQPAGRRPPGGGAGDRLAGATARFTGSLCGALVAGVLVLGLGFRLVMRILAATSAPAVQGRLTDADEVIGRVTLGGTLEIVGFVGLLGGLAGLALFGVLRRWLPTGSLAAGLLTGGIGAGLAARPTGVLRPDSTDFTVLTPRWLAVALVLLLLLTFALLAAVLVDRWATTWPRPARSLKGVAGLAPLVPLVATGPPGIVALVAIAFGAFASPALAVARWVEPIDRLARMVVLAGAACGTAWLLVSAGRIVAG